MAGNHNSGRKPIDDPKTIKTVRIKQSTLERIQDIAFELGTTESAVIQAAVENFTQTIGDLIKK